MDRDVDDDKELSDMDDETKTVAEVLEETDQEMCDSNNEKKRSSDDEDGEDTLLDEPAEKRMKTADEDELVSTEVETPEEEETSNDKVEEALTDKEEEELLRDEDPEPEDPEPEDPELEDLEPEDLNGADPDEPMETTESTEIMDTTETTETAETTETLELSEVGDQSETAEPVAMKEMVELSETAEKAEPSESTNPTKSAETVETTDKGEMAEVNEMADVDKPAETKSDNLESELSGSDGDNQKTGPEELATTAEADDIGQDEKMMDDDIGQDEKMMDDPLTVNGRMDDDDNSTVRSDDSEKENINTDMPMDLSTKSSIPSDDVITLSDSSDDDHGMNGIGNGIVELTPEERASRRKLVKLLQAELRNEEAKLVLLKKMRQSQVTQQLQDHSNFTPSNKQNTTRAHAGHPPPLIRGGQSSSSMIMGNHKPLNNQMTSSHLMRGQSLLSMRPQMQGPPPLVMAPRMSSHQMQPAGLRGGLPPGAAPPNLLQGFRGQLHQQVQAQAQAQAQAQVHAQQLAQHQQQQADNQTPAQRQAAAKLALRKQLEKTLLQIPPPKPPPPEMNFIPSLISNEFIMLVGLEEVVNYITDTDLIARGEKSADEKLVCTPFTCIQCDTDFTPVWKREKPGSKHVICEMCVTTNQKKALKQEHTNRLKSAFVKALQQEQEIERMQSQSVSTPSTTSAAQVTAPVNLTAPSYKQQSAQVVAAAAAEQLRHHQNFIQAHQAHQAHLRATQPMGIPTFNPRGQFHYQIPFKHSDLQRQYLLDMIPSRSMAQGNIGWKS